MENDVYLKSMRVNKEGIVPYFNKEINEYYLTIGTDISNLEISAESENTDNRIDIKGNTNLKEGMNKITIEVLSKDESQKNIYYIYVTKTTNKESANTNLENLAVENVILTPEFSNNTSFYKAEIDNNIENLNILAFPENINANVEIVGNQNLQIGKNVIVINAKGENGYSFRRYYIEVYRRNKGEDAQYLEAKRFETQKLSSILGDKMETNLDNRSSNTTNNVPTVFVVIVIITIIAIIGIVLKRKKKS